MDISSLSLRFDFVSYAYGYVWGFHCYHWLVIFTSTISIPMESLVAIGNGNTATAKNVGANGSNCFRKLVLRVDTPLTHLVHFTSDSTLFCSSFEPILQIYSRQKGSSMNRITNYSNS